MAKTPEERITLLEAALMKKDIEVAQTQIEDLKGELDKLEEDFLGVQREIAGVKNIAKFFTTYVFPSCVALLGGIAVYFGVQLNNIKVSVEGAAYKLLLEKATNTVGEIDKQLVLATNSVRVIYEDEQRANKVISGLNLWSDSNLKRLETNDGVLGENLRINLNATYVGLDALMDTFQKNLTASSEKGLTKEMGRIKTNAIPAVTNLIRQLSR